jgi:hypothetical protein
MSKLVLLIVGAMWMAVLLPPLLRSRFDGGAVSSVSDFRRQLNTLQRTQSHIGAAHPMRAMTRPLAPSHRPMPARAPRPQAPRAAARPRLVASDGVLEHEARPRRSHHTEELPRRHFAAETSYLSPREVIRRRRVNILYALVALNAVSLFLGLTTGSNAMVYVFTVAFLGLGAYCYILVQIRNQEYLRRYHGQRRAA